jgi:hypothetical protein
VSHACIPRGGIAKLHGHLVQLTEAPAIPGLRLVAIDYVPEIGLRQVMPHGHAWRDMTDAEAAHADRLLQTLTADLRAMSPASPSS